jgi:hypothetical protein
MTRFVTSLFLAALLVDIASAAISPTHGDGHEPPHGIRRMIETLENKKKGDHQCARERRERSLVTPNRIQVC